MIWKIPTQYYPPGMNGQGKTYDSFSHTCLWTDKYIHHWAVQEYVQRISLKFWVDHDLANLLKHRDLYISISNIVCLHAIEGLENLLFMINFESTMKGGLTLMFSGKNPNKCLPKISKYYSFILYA